MKAFKKWNESNPTSYGLEECGREDGWKEALEWMKEKLKCEIQSGDIEYFIDQELKEK